MLGGGRGISSTGPSGRRTHKHPTGAGEIPTRPADVRLHGVCHRVESWLRSQYLGEVPVEGRVGVDGTLASRSRAPCP